MESFNFVLLGTEGCGKTSFLKKVVSQKKKNSLFILNQSPQNSINSAYKPICIDCVYNGMNLANINICDYTGRVFSEDYSEELIKASVQSDVNNADILIVMVDGAFFLSENTKEICRTIKRKCARFITPYISGYSSENDGKLPTVIFTITKCRKVLLVKSGNEIREILRSTFSSLFDSNGNGFSEPFTICIETDIDNYSINLPFLLGVNYMMNEKGLTNGTTCELLSKELQKYQNFVITQNNDFNIRIASPDNHTVKLPNNSLITRIRRFMKLKIYGG